MSKAKTHVEQHSQVHHMQDRVTDGVAVTMVASMWWLPGLEVWSQIAAPVSSILGLIWLLFQIGSKLAEWHAKWMVWRIKRAQAKHIIAEMKRNEEYDSAVGGSEVVGRRSGIPGDEGSSWP